MQEQRRRLPGMQGMARYDIHFIGILRSGTQEMQRRECAKQADVPTGKSVYYLQYNFATLKTLSCIFACPDSGECPGYGSQKKWTKSGTGLAGTAWG